MKKILLLIFFIFAGILSVNSETLNIIQVTDIHYTKENPEPLDSFVRRVNNLKNIDFVVFTGDNTDKSNVKDLKTFLDVTSKINKPYYIMLGNHDAYKASGIPKQDYMEYVKLYNKNQRSLNTNFSIKPARGLVAVMLDGAVPFVPSSHGFFNDKTLAYFDKILTKNKNKKVLVFQHFPIVPPREHYGHTVLEPEKYIKILNSHDNVVLIASGHYHHPNVTVDDNGVQHISTASLGKNRVFKRIEIVYKNKLFGPPEIKKINLTDLSI